MTVLVAAFGLLVAGFGVLGAARPAALIALVRSAWSTPLGVYPAAGFRLAFGIVLLGAAPASATPRAFVFLGWLSLASAVAALLLGEARALAFVGWWSERPAWLVRAWSLAAVAFGAFLIAAVV